MTNEHSEDICPVCGYYCLGNGGDGCIDKPALVERAVLAKRDEERDAIVYRQETRIHSLEEQRATLENTIDHLKAQLAMLHKEIEMMVLPIPDKSVTALDICKAISSRTEKALNATAEDVAKYKAEIEKSVLEELLDNLASNTEGAMTNIGRMIQQRGGVR